MSVIDATGLTKRYGDVTVLDGLDVTVAPGETVALLGPNGAGKTTTVEILAGFTSRDGGRATVLGADPGRETSDEWRSRLSLVLQVWRDHGRWRVSEFLEWITCHYQGSSGRPPYSTGDLLDRFELTAHAAKPVNKLSGGLRRRLDFAAAIAGRPELVFLDEPTTGLDPTAKRMIHDVVDDLTSEETTIFLTTHDLAEAERLADRIMILAGGELIAAGSSDQLRRDFSRETQVTWRVGSERHVHATSEPEAFVRSLLIEPSITDLEVKRSSLEDAYIALVSHHTTSAAHDEATASAERTSR